MGASRRVSAMATLSTARARHRIFDSAQDHHDNAMERAVTLLRSPDPARLRRIIARDTRRFDTSLKLATKGRVSQYRIHRALFPGHTESRTRGGGGDRVIFQQNRNSIKDFIADARGLTRARGTANSRDYLSRDAVEAPTSPSYPVKKFAHAHTCTYKPQKDLSPMPR